MINVAFNTQTQGELLITLDHEGIESLVHQLRQLLGKPPDHIHLCCPSWSSPEGADLDERRLAGEDYHCCHMLTLATQAERREHRAQVYIEATTSGLWRRHYTGLTATILYTHAELHELLASLSELAVNKGAFSRSLPSSYELKRRFCWRKQGHNRLSLRFQFSENFTEKG